MDITTRRPEFSVFVIEREPTAANAFAESLRAVGYEDVLFFPTLESALGTARQEPPHLVLLDFHGFEGEAESFLTELQALSSEILTILLIPAKHYLPALQLIGRSLAYDSIIRPYVSTLELLQKMDRALARLYFQFESEQLREHYKGVSATQAPAHVEQQRSDSDLRAANEFKELNVCLERFLGTKDLDQTVQLSLDSFSRLSGDTPVLYFKYLPSHLSLLFSQCSLLPSEKFRGIGVDLKTESVHRLPELFNNPAGFAPLKTLVNEIFKKDAFTAFTHFNDDEVLGVFVALGRLEFDSPASRVLSVRRAFEMAYKRNLTIKEKHAVDIYDPNTGAFNRRFFNRLLDDEIARSRRLLLPVSLLLIETDQGSQIREKLGVQQSEALLKTLVQILRRTARTNDLVARTGPFEMACLLPHTPHKGAVIKAERVRQTIESTKIPLLESLGIVSPSISCGVSEYPTLCTESDGLMRSADGALRVVKSKGGNRICLSEVNANFKPDFVPFETPADAQRFAGKGTA